MLVAESASKLLPGAGQQVWVTRVQLVLWVLAPLLEPLLEPQPVLQQQQEERVRLEARPVEQLEVR